MSKRGKAAVGLSRNRPPWLSDSQPAAWVRLPDAARLYFRKHPETVRRMAVDGTLRDACIPTYFDGTRWWIRLELEAGTAR